MTEKTQHGTRSCDNALASKKRDHETRTNFNRGEHGDLASKKPDHETRTNFNRGEYVDLASKKRHTISEWFGTHRFSIRKNNVTSMSLSIRYKGKTILKKRRLCHPPEPHEITGLAAKLAGWNEKTEIYDNDGQYIMYVDAELAWSVKVYRNSIETFRIKHNIILNGSADTCHCAS